MSQRVNLLLQTLNLPAKLALLCLVVRHAVLGERQGASRQLLVGLLKAVIGLCLLDGARLEDTLVCFQGVDGALQLAKPAKGSLAFNLTSTGPRSTGSWSHLDSAPFPSRCSPLSDLRRDCNVSTCLKASSRQSFALTALDFRHSLLIFSHAFGRFLSKLLGFGGIALQDASLLASANGPFDDDLPVI